MYHRWFWIMIWISGMVLLRYIPSDAEKLQKHIHQIFEPSISIILYHTMHKLHRSCITLCINSWSSKVSNSVSKEVWNHFVPLRWMVSFRSHMSEKIEVKRKKQDMKIVIKILGIFMCYTQIAQRLVSIIGWGTMLQTRRSPVRFPWVHLIFQLTYSSQPHYGPWVNSASNRNEYQESSWGVKGGRR
jgi:hypothetical protein